MTEQAARRRVDPALEATIRRADQLRASGKAEDARKIYDELAARHGDDGAVQYRLGLGLAQAGLWDAAAARIERAVALDPNLAEAHFDLGAIYGGPLKRDEAAAECFRAALTAREEYPEAHLNLGNILALQGDDGQALVHFDRAIALRPGLFIAHFNRANALKKLGRMDDAIKSYGFSLKFDPGFLPAHLNLGNTYLALERPKDALAVFDNVLRHHPDRADFWSARATAAKAMGLAEEALAGFNRALALAPDHADALSGRGGLLEGLDRFDEAAVDYQRLYDLQPEYPFNAGHLLYARLMCCDWAPFDALRGAITQAVRAGKPAVQPWHFLAISDDPADQLACARRWVESQCPEPAAPLWRGETWDHDRIRVAYVCADFTDHPVAQLMVDVWEGHDRARFETFAIDIGAGERNAFRCRLEKAFDHFLDVSAMTNAAIAGLIRDRDIAILIDCNGHTAGARPGIFAARPAPVQASWLAYPGSLGAGYMDYILADGTVIPENARIHYSEAIARLPDSYIPTDPSRPVPEGDNDRAAARADAGLPEGAFVFCSFSKSYKILPATFAIWMNLLRAVAGSVLWLSATSASARRNLCRAAHEHGVDPARLFFATRADSFDAYLARLRLADLFLDTLPYNAHSTACDAFRAGLPVVTLAGRAFAARGGASLLRAVGLAELVTASPAEYESLALALARDPARLAGLRHRLDHNRRTAPLFDAARMCRNVETAFEIMWRRARDGEAPQDFTVAP